MIVSLAFLASDVANQIVKDTESFDATISEKAYNMIHLYSKGLESINTGEITAAMKKRMVFYLKKVGTRISKDNVKIEAKSDSKYPQMAGQSELGLQKITIYPMAFTSPIYPTE